MYIYKTTNLTNGKIYVGQSLKSIKTSTEYYGSGKILNLAIKKYGKDNFKKEILYEATSIEDMNEKEIFFIKKLNSQDRNIGYNLADGGTGGDTSKFIDYTNPAYLEKLSKATSGKNNSQYGKVYTEDEKMKRQAFFDNNKKGKDNPNYGSKASEERKLKQSIAAQGENNSMFGKCWCVLSTAKNKSNRALYNKENIPENWISCEEFDDRKKKRNYRYGRFWYNDGDKNYLKLPTEAENENLIKGKIKK